MPADDLILNVNQIENYPDAGAPQPTDAILLQRGGLGGPYLAINPVELVAGALGDEGTLAVGLAAPADAANGQVFADLLCLPLSDAVLWNAYSGAGVTNHLTSGPAALLRVDPVAGWQFFWGPAGAAGAPVAFGAPQIQITPTGYISVADQVLLARDPAAPLESATMQWVLAQVAGNPALVALQDQYASATVWSFNGRTGDVVLTLQDVQMVGGAPIFSPAFQGCPTAPIPPAWSNDNTIATTSFVNVMASWWARNAVSALNAVTSFNGRIGDVVLTAADVDAALAAGGAYAPLASPQFSGVPTAPTAPPGTSDGQLATTAFVENAVVGSVTGVSSFNARTGAVILSAADITSAGGALLASPVFTGAPQAPTAAPGTATAQLATCAFVQAAGGVSSFNGRSGAVTLTLADVTGVGGAPLASPVFTGAPQAPTAAPGTSSTQLATTAFITANTAVSFNGRQGAVTFQANDLSAVGGALLASPAFTGTPAAPTATPGTSTTQLATTAFVTAALATVGGVTSFNGRAGVVNLTSTDITGVGGALLASPTFTGTPAAPTATPGTSTTQLATTAFVAAAISGYLPLGGGTLTGALIIALPSGTGLNSLNVSPAAGACNVALNIAAAGSNRQFVGQTAGVARWNLVPGNSIAESGSNAGSDFGIVAYSDSGALLGSALYIWRANGATALNGYGATAYSGAGAVGDANLVLNKTGSTHQSRIFGANNGVFRWGLALGNATAESGSNAGSDFQISAYSDSGGAPTVSTPLSIARSSGQATFAVAIVNGSSDRRLKENIKPIDDALAKVMGLQGVSFNMIATPDKPEIGLIAQDVEAVVPEIVQHYDAPDASGRGEVKRLALDYPKLVAVLIEAVKALTARVEVLEGRKA